jgi:hypothetical protein
MATATMLPDLAVGLAETMADAFETRRVEELTSDEVSAAIFACHFLRDLFAMARRSIADGLARGADARAFAARYEQGVTGLEAVLTATERVVRKARTGPLPPPAEQFLSNYRALMDDILSLHQFLAEAVAKAKLPARPIDQQRVHEAEAAYARGETKPFQPSQKS